MVLLLVLSCGSSQPPAPELQLGELLAIGSQRRWEFHTSEGKATGTLPWVPVDGRLAELQPTHIRSGPRTGARPGLLAIGPATLVARIGEQKKLGTRIVHFGLESAVHDLGPWPPDVPGVSFQDASPTRDLQLVGMSGSNPVLVDPETHALTPVPVPEGLSFDPGDAQHWLDVVASAPPTWVASTPTELVWWQGDTVLGRQAVSRRHRVLASTGSSWFAATALEGSGFLVDTTTGKVRDLAEGKTPPNDARLMFGRGSWDPAGGFFAWWSSEHAGCSNNGYACNERFDIVKVNPDAQDLTTTILYQARSGIHDAPWAWTQHQVFRRLEPLPVVLFGK